MYGPIMHISSLAANINHTKLKVQPHYACSDTKLNGQSVLVVYKQCSVLHFVELSSGATGVATITMSQHLW